MSAHLNFQNKMISKICGMKPRVCMCLILVSVFSTGNSTAYGQKRFSVSAGVSHKWSINKSKLENSGEDNVVSDGSIGYFASIGINWSDDPDMHGLCRITYENFESSLQNWERIPIGTLKANVFRVDPLYFQYRIRKSKFIYNFNLAGFSIFTGKSSLLPDSYCYDDGLWYLIHQVHVNNSIGWSLIGFGFDYEFTPWLTAGIESVMIEDDRINVTFLTDVGDIKSNVTSVNSFFPIKFKLILKM